MASVIQCGSRKGSSMIVPDDGAMGVIQPPDFRQVTVLTKAEWERIQDELKRVNKEEESLREAAKEREALVLKSQEVVRGWSNTIAGQRQKKLEAKKIREAIEEEKRKQIDLEEAKYQEEKRKEAIKKAETQMYYKTERLKGFHSALLLTEVLKEREVQIELKQKLESARKEGDKRVVKARKAKNDEDERKEKEKEKRREDEKQATLKELKKQIKEIEQVREQEKQQVKKDGEEIQHQLELYQWEQAMNSEKLENKKKNLLQANLEQVTNQELQRVADKQKEENEEEMRNIYLSIKKKMKKMRTEKEKELMGEFQRRRESIMHKLVATQEEQQGNEDERIRLAAAEKDAKEALKHQQEEEKRAAQLSAIAAHRDLQCKEKKDNEKEAKWRLLQELEAKKEADRIYLERQKERADKNREERTKTKDFNVSRMVKNSDLKQQMKVDARELAEWKIEKTAEQEKEFQEYAQKVIKEATEAQKNVIPLCKAAREGFGGGLGPVFTGVRPNYLAEDLSGAELASYSHIRDDMRKYHRPADLQDVKKRHESTHKHAQKTVQQF